MYKKVLIKAFEKAKEDIPGKSNKTNRSEHISNVLLEDFKYQVSGKTLRNHFDKSINSNAETDISINSDYVHNLCLFLGFKNYQEFLEAYPDAPTEANNHWLLTIIKKNKAALIISIVAITIVISITTFNTQRWMIWNDTHYVEVDFDAEKYSLSQLKIYDQDRIDDFRRVIPDCKTAFYNADDTVNLWYGKNTLGELEYFTTLAKHPETGKALKEITDYMIRKYICESH